MVYMRPGHVQVTQQPQQRILLIAIRPVEIQPWNSVVHTQGEAKLGACKGFQHQQRRVGIGGVGQLADVLLRAAAQVVGDGQHFLPGILPQHFQ